MPVGKPKMDTRPGVAAVTTARIWICGIICIIQYWLFTSSVEAVNGGNHAVAIPMFLASLLCFALVAGLIITGEVGARKVQEDLKKD